MTDEFDPLAEAERLRDRLAFQKRATAAAAVLLAVLLLFLLARGFATRRAGEAPAPPSAGSAPSPAPAPPDEGRPAAGTSPSVASPAPAVPPAAGTSRSVASPAPAVPPAGDVLPAVAEAPSPAADPLAAALALLGADPGRAADLLDGGGAASAATVEVSLLATLLRLEAGRFDGCAARLVSLPSGPERAFVDRQVASLAAGRIFPDRYGLSAECRLFRVEEAPVASEEAPVVALRRLPGRRALSYAVAEGGSTLFEPATGEKRREPSLLSASFSTRGNLLLRRAGFLSGESELSGTSGLADLPARLAGRRAALRAFELSADGGLLALATVDGAYRVVDTASGLARFEALRRGVPAEGARPFAFAGESRDREPRRLYFAWGREPGVLSVSALDLGRFEESRIASVRVASLRAVGLDAAPRTHLLFSCVAEGEERPSIRIAGRFGAHPARILDDAAFPAIDRERGGFYFARGGEIRFAALRPLAPEAAARALAALPAAAALALLEGARDGAWASLRASLEARRDEERAELIFHGGRVLERLGRGAAARARYEAVLRDLPATAAAALCRLALEKFAPTGGAR